MSSLRQLHPHQSHALDLLRTSLRTGHRRPLLQAPTGFGKTVVGAHIVAGIHRHAKRVAFCVPALSLVDQTFERFRENGIDPVAMGVIQGNHPYRRPHAPIQIATAQTLTRRDLPEVDYVVVDEAHIRHKVYDRWMAEQPGTVFVGLTATPWSAGLGKLYDDLLKPTSLAELIAGGYLSTFRVFAPSRPDLSGVRTVAGDYHEGDLEVAMNKTKLVADIVDTWLARADGRPTLCFATSRKHAKAIHDQFEAVGVPVAYVDANTPRDERDDIGRALARGEVKVVCNIGTLTTGIDWDVRCIILARPTKSESLFVQIIGRGLRTAAGKDHCLILDHSDTHLRLGMVTDIDRDELDTGRGKVATAAKREKRVPLPKCCASCAALMPVLSTVCPACGAEQPKTTGVTMIDGELVEVGSAVEGKPARESVLGRLQQQGKVAVYGQLLCMAHERGHKDGWAAHKYREIFGVWPRGLAGSLYDPTPELMSWIRHRNIAWAKAKPRATDADTMARVARDLTGGAHA